MCSPPSWERMGRENKSPKPDMSHISSCMTERCSDTTATSPGKEPIQKNKASDVLELSKRHGDRKMWGREIKVWVSSVPLFWSLAWRQSEQGELGGTEKTASPQGSHSALQVLSGGVLWGLCVYMCVCGFVYLCVCVCAGGNKPGKRRKR